MAESNPEQSGTRDWFSRVSTALRRAARSRLLGTALAAGGLWFAFSRWPPLPELDLTAAEWLVAFGVGGGAYFAALFALAMVMLPSRSAVLAALSSHIFKYVPGAVWQLQPVIASSGVSGASLLVAATLVAAGLGLTWSNLGALALTGAGLVLAICVLVWWRTNLMAALRVLLAGATTATLIAASGGIIGYLVDGRAFAWARTLVNAWAIGLLAVPVPAGVGIREATIAALDVSPAAPLVAGLHRSITVAVDLLVGSVAWLEARQHSRDRWEATLADDGADF